MDLGVLHDIPLFLPFCPPVYDIPASFLFFSYDLRSEQEIPILSEIHHSFGWCSHLLSIKLSDWDF